MANLTSVFESHRRTDPYHKSISLFVGFAGVATPATTMSLTPVCPTCGTFKTGVRSCCALNGAWASRCGDKADYTYDQGRKACENANGKAQMQVTLHETTMKELFEAVQQPTSSSSTDAADTPIYKGWICAISCLLFIVLLM